MTVLELAKICKGKNLSQSVRDILCRDGKAQANNDTGLYYLEASEELVKGNTGGFIDHSLKGAENTVRESGQAAATFILGKNSKAYNATRYAYNTGMGYLKDAYNYLSWW